MGSLFVIHAVWGRGVGGTAGAVVKAACLENQRLRVQTPLWPSSVKETKCFFAAHS